MDQLSQIATFVKVVEAGGFSAAARELGVAPSVVTAHVQSLEKRLGARLLNRNTRHVAATEAGIVYYRRCTDLLKRFEEAEEAIGSIQRIPTGSLRINASMLVPHLINPVISRYGAKYPEVSVRLTVTGQMVDLIDENYDLGVRHKVPASPSVVVRKLAEYRFVVCGSPHYFKRRKAPATPAELAEHNCLIYTDSGHGERWPVFEAHEQVPLKGNLYSNDILSLIEAAESGLGITVAPDFALKESVGAGRLIPVLSDYTTRSFPITLMYPQRGSHPAKVRIFVEMLADHLRQNMPGSQSAWVLGTGA